EQRGEDAYDGPETGPDVDNRDTNPHGRPSLFPGDAHQSAVGLHQGVVARARCHGSRAAEGRQTAVDQTRFARGELGGPEAERLDAVGAQVLNEYISALHDEPQQHVAASALAQIESRTELVPVERME